MTWTQLLAFDLTLRAAMAAPGPALLHARRQFIAGALYLLRVAWGLWRDARRPVSNPAQPGARAFLGGMLVNLANPESVLFAASVLLLIFPPDLGPAQKTLILANHVAVDLTVYGAFAALLSTPPARTGYLRLKPVIDRAAALILGALGLRPLTGR